MFYFCVDTTKRQDKKGSKRERVIFEVPYN